MSRIDFITPNQDEWLQKFNFETKIKVRFSETDAFGHLNNVSHIIYFEQARLDYFQEVEMLDYFMDSATFTMMVTADIHCHYMSQIFFGQPLGVKVRVPHLGNSSADIQYAIVDTRDQRLLATARGSIVHINKKTGKSAPWPEQVRSKITQFEERETS